MLILTRPLKVGVVPLNLGVMMNLKKVMLTRTNLPAILISKVSRLVVLLNRKVRMLMLLVMKVTMRVLKLKTHLIVLLNV